jgi:MFS transporter, SET family, sugar efflux transporter
MQPAGWGSLRVIWADPSLRAAALLIVLLGASMCALGPYVAHLAVGRFDLGDRGYSALLALSTTVSVCAAVWVGIRSDQTGRRRQLALVAAGLLVAGTGLMSVAPGRISFVLAHGLILPLSTLFGQIFSLARIAGQPYDLRRRTEVMATIRALCSLPFVVLLPLWALSFRMGLPLMAIYPVAVVLNAALFWVVWTQWPNDRVLASGSAPSGLNFRAALREIARPRVALRVVALGAVVSVGTVYWAVLGLVLVPGVGRDEADVALYLALVAAAEVPFMMAVPRLSRGISRPAAMLMGTAIFLIHLLGLSVLAGSPFLWLLVVPAALGGSFILTLPIAYLQDLMADRPGTSSSLLAVQKLTGDLMAAGCFALGTTLSGYGLVTILDGILALGGALALVLVDRRGAADKAGRASPPGPSRDI